MVSRRWKHGASFALFFFFFPHLSVWKLSSGLSQLICWDMSRLLPIFTDLRHSCIFCSLGKSLGVGSFCRCLQIRPHYWWLIAKKKKKQQLLATEFSYSSLWSLLSLVVPLFLTSRRTSSRRLIYVLKEIFYLLTCHTDFALFVTYSSKWAQSWVSEVNTNFILIEARVKDLLPKVKNLA